jgi:hypothetical protein
MGEWQKLQKQVGEKPMGFEKNLRNTDAGPGLRCFHVNKS